MEDRTYKALDAVFSSGSILDQARLRALNKDFRDDHLHPTEQTRREMYEDLETAKYICERRGWHFVKQPGVIEEECKKSVWMNNSNWLFGHNAMLGDYPVEIMHQSEELFNKYFTKDDDTEFKKPERYYNARFKRTMVNTNFYIRTTVDKLKSAIKRGLIHDPLTKFNKNYYGTNLEVGVPGSRMIDESGMLDSGRFHFYKNKASLPNFTNPGAKKWTETEIQEVPLWKF